MAGCYILKAVKVMELQVMQALWSLTKSVFSNYYRAGFTPKMSDWELL
uniref:Uncharacterized protein n=1 Tax=Salvator merianae TaxID=96440 RepID=A0A8D0C6F6_SALMN